MRSKGSRVIRRSAGSGLGRHSRQAPIPVAIAKCMNEVTARSSLAAKYVTMPRNHASMFLRIPWVRRPTMRIATRHNCGQSDVVEQGNESASHNVRHGANRNAEPEAQHRRRASLHRCRAAEPGNESCEHRQTTRFSAALNQAAKAAATEAMTVQRMNFHVAGRDWPVAAFGGSLERVRCSL